MTTLGRRFRLALLAIVPLGASLVFSGQASAQCAEISGSLSFCGEPLNDVTVLLKKGDDVILYDSTTSDASGSYTLTAPTLIPPLYRVVVQASSAAAEVRKDFLATPHEFNIVDVPTSDSCTLRDFAIETEGSLDCNEPQNSEDGRHGLAIWMAGEVLQGRAALQAALPSLGSGNPPQLIVRYPSGGTDPDPTDEADWPAADNAFYYGPANEMNIGQNKVDALFHEYGHFLQDQVASWISIPDYGGTCAVNHLFRCDQSCTVWPYFEALGHLVESVVNSAMLGVAADPTNPFHPFNTADGISPSDMGRVIESPEIVPVPTECPSGVALGTSCENDIFLLPQLTEGTVAAALWDLIDVAPDFGPGCLPSVCGTSRPPVQDASTLPLATIFEVVEFTTSANFPNPCNPANSRPNPITTQQFVETWRLLNSGPQPQLWSAFATNNMDFDGNDPPSSVFVDSTHPVATWTNSPFIAVRIDQQDNFSGVADSFSVFDNSPTAVSTWAFPTPSRLKQTLAVNPQSLHNAPLTATDFTTTVPSSGTYYLHTQARDYQGNEETGMLDVGPLLVDLETPTLELIEPGDGSTFVNTGSMFTRWRSDDSGPAVSGISRIVVRFADPNVLYTITMLDQNYSGPATPPIVAEGPTLVDDDITWPIHSSVPLTDTGEITVWAIDVAGNEVFSETVRNIRIIAADPERDTDGDGASDTEDEFPNDPAEKEDTDGDGTGNNADADDDGDGFSDAVELASGTDPLDAESTPALFHVPGLAPTGQVLLLGLLGAGGLRALWSRRSP